MSDREKPLLSDALRLATGQAHAQLEATLDLLAPPLSELRFRQVLEGFHGFHSAWEPALVVDPRCAGIFSGRSRLAALRTDLAALGRSEAQIDALPACPGAAALAATPLSAIGSLYVMEGSTLGGRLIARALASAPWRPSRGLLYFDPYGSQAGERWRSFKAWLNAAALPQDWPETTAAAIATFQTLSDWLSAPAPASPDPNPRG